MSERDGNISLELLKRLESQAVQKVEHLKSSGGGDNYDGMEARVARLESDVGHIARDVSELRGDMKDARDRLARIEEKVAQLPTKGWGVAVVLAIIAIIGALITLQSQIQGWLGIAG